ncbi:porin, partial [Thermocrinis sp.]
MRKSLLAMAALMGVATLPAHAWRVKVDDQTFADIGFSTMIRGTFEGKRATGEKSRLDFSVPLTNITAGGQVNKLVYFFINAESDGAQNGFITRDSFIGLKFADEFRLQAGWQRAPFSRVALTSTYALLVPTSYAGQGLAVNPTNVQSNVPNGSPRDVGVVVWGNVAGGMLKYYLGVTDGATAGSSTDDSLAYTVRLQFTPTMLGFKGETGYGLSDTYLGAQNVMSIGVGYRVVGRGGTDKDTKMWTADMLYEQKFGDIVPNLQVGYINVKDAVYVEDNTPRRVNKVSQLYVQGQLLYDQVVG